MPGAEGVAGGALDELVDPHLLVRRVGGVVHQVQAVQGRQGEPGVTGETGSGSRAAPCPAAPVRSEAR